MKDAADSILSNMAEGFEQPTDRAFAKYLFTSKASIAEVRKRLLVACHRGHITKEEYTAHNELGDEVARMTTGLIKYLIRSDREDRGLGLNQSPKRAAKPERPRLTTLTDDSD